MFSDSLKHFKAIHAWQYDIQDYEVVLSPTGELQTAYAIWSNVDYITIVCQAAPQRFGKFPLVFNKKNFHL
ncbi:hypothetical protein L505_0545 [Bordetella bronchiseptica F4563]|nr:hypothetical protein L505_0545 [Bordetella bronchiseptica F4563]